MEEVLLMLQISALKYLTAKVLSTQFLVNKQIEAEIKKFGHI